MTPKPLVSEDIIRKLEEHLRGTKTMKEVEEEAILGEADCEVIVKVLRFLRGETS